MHKRKRQRHAWTVEWKQVYQRDREEQLQRVFALILSVSRNGGWGPRSALPTQGAPSAHLGLESCCSFWYFLRHANRSHLRSISWKNRTIVRLGSVQEQTQTAKPSRSPCHTTTRCFSSSAPCRGRFSAR